MEEYKYNNAIIRIKGDVDREKIREATIKFMKKVEIEKQKKTKGRIQNGDSNKS